MHKKKEKSAVFQCVFPVRNSYFCPSCTWKALHETPVWPMEAIVQWQSNVFQMLFITTGVYIFALKPKLVHFKNPEFFKP